MVEVIPLRSSVEVRQEVGRRLRRMAEEWSGLELELSTVYGPRRYRRDDERRHRHHRDNRSYYDRREERRRRDEEDDEDDRRSHRDYRDRYRVKREPRDYDERYSVREYDDDRSSHKHPSRPSSRAGSVSHYDPDSSMRGFNMSNMSMSGQWAFMQQQQAMLQQAMQQQMMALNPLQFQVMSTHSQPVWCNVKVILVRFCLVSPH